MLRCTSPAAQVLLQAGSGRVDQRLSASSAAARSAGAVRRERIADEQIDGGVEVHEGTGVWVNSQGLWWTLAEEGSAKR